MWWLASLTFQKKKFKNQICVPKYSFLVITCKSRHNAGWMPLTAPPTAIFFEVELPQPLLYVSRCNILFRVSGSWVPENFNPFLAGPLSVVRSAKAPNSVSPHDEPVSRGRATGSSFRSLPALQLCDLAVPLPIIDAGDAGESASKEGSRGCITSNGVAKGHRCLGDPKATLRIKIMQDGYGPSFKRGSKNRRWKL